MPAGVKGFQRGAPRAPGAGRKKGGLNKRTKSVMEILHANKLDPVRELIECYHRTANTDEVMHLGIKCLEILMPYCYSKVTPNSVTENHLYLVQQIEEMAKRPRHEIVEIVKSEMKKLE